MKRLVIFIMACVLLAGAVHALSVSPAKYAVQHHDGEDEYTITLTNDEQRTITATLTPTGPLRELITVQEQVTLAPGEQKSIAVRVQMPQTTQPGVLESGVLIEGRLVSGGTVGATSAVMHVIRIETPREGLFLNGALLSSSGIVGEQMLLTVSLTNTGTEAIDDASASITLQGPVSAELTAPSVSVAPGETKNIVVPWMPAAIGLYEAQARVRYSGRELLLTNTVIVGNLSITITDIDVGEFRLGELFRVAVALRNNWGQSLPVTAAVRVTQQGSLVAQAQSASVQAPSGATTTVPLFVDSAGMAVGEAQMQVTVSYADQQTSSFLPLVVGVDTLGAEEQASAPERTWWPVLLVLAAAIAFTSIIFIKRRRSL